MSIFHLSVKSISRSTGRSAVAAAAYRAGDQRNHHAHLLTTTRELRIDGLGSKTRMLDVSSTASVEVEALRERWGALSNSALERAQIPRRIDHRSFKRQGLEFEPTIKLGPIASAIEQRANRRLGQGSIGEPVTERGHLNALIKEMRTLSNHIDRGRTFLNHMRSEAVRTAKQKLLRIYTERSPIASLQQAVSRVSEKIIASQNPDPKRKRSLER